MGGLRSFLGRLERRFGPLWRWLGARIDPRAAQPGVIVGTWMAVVALLICVGQCNRLLLDMHPAGGRSGGVTELTSPLTTDAGAREMLASWGVWDEQRISATHDRGLAGLPQPDVELTDISPRTVVNWYVIFDAVLALALVVALRLLVVRLRSRFPTDEAWTSDPATAPDQYLKASRRLLTATSGTLGVYLLSDWAESAFVLTEVHGQGSQSLVRIAAACKVAALALTAFPLGFAWLVARRRLSARPTRGSVRHTLLALRLHIAAAGVLIVTLTVLPGSVRPQVVDAVRFWGSAPHHGILAIVAVAVLTAALWFAGAVQLRRDQASPRRSLTGGAIWGLVTIGVGLGLVGITAHIAALVPLGGLVISSALLSISLTRTVTDRPSYRTSWVTLGALCAGVPASLWVAIARAGIEPTKGLKTRIAVMVAVTLVTAVLVAWCLRAGQRAAARARSATAPGGWPVASHRGKDLMTFWAGVAVATAGAALAVNVIVSHGDGREAAVDGWGSIAIVAVAALALLGLAVVVGWTFHRPPRGMFVVLRIRRPPIVSLVVVLTLAVSLFAPAPQFHLARTLGGRETENPVARATLSLDDSGRQFARRADARDNPGVQPVIVVAASGGGARSAYWTTLVFDCLFGDGSSPKGGGGLCGDLGLSFDEDVFAVSGVSGGSVGATMYANTAWAGTGGGGPPLGTWNASHLDPIMSNLLFVDAPNALINAGSPPDRAEALELAWERAQPSLARGLFDTQWPGNAIDSLRFPLLVLNGATLDGGCRLNISVLDLAAADPLDARAKATGGMGGGVKAGIDSSCRSITPYAPPARTAPSQGGSAGVLEGTIDLADHLCDGADIRLSTAALLSARFPVVSPSGALRQCRTGGYIYDVDGGLVDSSAASTASAIVERVRPLETAGDGSCRQIVVIQIDNGYDVDTPPPIDANPGQLRGLLTGVLAATGSRSAEERQRLAELASGLKVCRDEDAAGAIPYVRLAPRSHPGVQAPRGWLLSKPARDDLAQQLTTPENQCSLAGLAQLLGRPVGTEDVHCIAGTLRDKAGTDVVPGRDVCIVAGRVEDRFTCNDGVDRHFVRTWTDSAGTFRAQLTPSAVGATTFSLGTRSDDDDPYVAIVSGAPFTQALTVIEPRVAGSPDVVRVPRVGTGEFLIILLFLALVGPVALWSVSVTAGWWPRDEGVPHHLVPGDAHLPGGFLVWAHQGGAKEGPSNTLHAMRAAIVGGADGLAFDVHRSLDGHLVVIHDPIVDSTTNGSGRVDGLTLPELRQLDAAYRFVPGRGTVPGRPPDAYVLRSMAGVPPAVTIPTLDEVLTEFPAAPCIIEVKDPAAAGAVVAAVRSYRADGSGIVLTSSDQATVERLLEHAAGATPLAVAPGWSGSFLFVLRAWIGRDPRPTPYGALHLPPRWHGIAFITDRVVASAASVGLRIDARIVDDPDEAHRLLALGVAGVMTDKPAELAAARDST